MPPVRSGHMVASSARQKHRKQPASVITPIKMMPSAPVPSTTAGAMPVTRIVPARPMTKAPHQFVPLARPCSGTDSCIEAMTPPRSKPLEERQVTLGLPVAHDGVPGVELLALDLRVIVDVVPVGRLAQRLARRVAGHEFVGRVQQGRRQHANASFGNLI